MRVDVETTVTNESQQRNARILGKLEGQNPAGSVKDRIAKQMILEAEADGTLKPGDEQFDAGRLGAVDIRGDNILLGEPFTFTEDNIDRFDF